MAAFDTELSQEKSALAAGFVAVAPALYAGTLFVSAFLLFSIQPMFTKMVLPTLGGAPAVWSVAMVFFQAALLAGYAYAHLLHGWLRAHTRAPQWAALVHFALLAAATSVLPISVAAGFGEPPQSGQHLWLLGLFAASVGLPFATLAASAPLLQSWFAQSDHRLAHNPYVLYAASNLGSFAALIAYPFVVEPLLSLREQAQLWSLGYAGLAVLVAIAAIAVRRGPLIETVVAVAKAPAVRWATRLHWLVLAAIPSGLVIGVTNFVSTDVAAAPFLWVIPLALYLLTFVAVFRERAWIKHETVIWLMPFVVGPMAMSVLGADKVFWLAVITLNLTGFVLLALLCHGELYRLRPVPARLTEFYLWVSLGGVVGGIFAGLIAPNVFSNTYEYPILIVAALLMVPGLLEGGWRPALRSAAPVLAVTIAAFVAALAFDVRLPAKAELPFHIVMVGVVALVLLQRSKPARVVSLVALIFVLSDLYRPGLAQLITARSFFGVHKVIESDDGRLRMLFHGTTIHGAELLRTHDGIPITGRPEPLTYYYFGGPLSEAIIAAREVHESKALGHAPLRAAVVGLGTGSLACHRQPGEKWTFFEIDPEVVRLARDSGLFRFLSACAPNAPIVLGDARLTLARANGTFDAIVLDAFSSDAIPVHLLTREAIASYLRKLTPHGLLIAHISNRHVALGGVLAAVAAAEGLKAAIKQDTHAKQSGVTLAANSLVAVLARSEADLAGLLTKRDWRPALPDPAITPWTDDYSDILSAMIRRKLGE